MVYVEKEVDLFSYENTHHLVQCISGDAAMGKGIAVTFCERKPEVLALRAQTPLMVGSVHNTGTVFNLITKNLYWQKPTLSSITMCITNMCILMRRAGVKNIAMPIIGCGLDRLRWSDVRHVLKTTFATDDVNTTVCFTKHNAHLMNSTL